MSGEWWKKEPAYVRRFRKGRAMIPRVCILCGEVWTPKPSDGDYDEACPRCRRNYVTDMWAKIDTSPTAKTMFRAFGNTDNKTPAKIGPIVDRTTVEDTPPEPTVAVPVATLREWLIWLTWHDDGTGAGIHESRVKDAIRTLLSTNAENDAGVESE
jgi:hypothetical protein